MKRTYVDVVGEYYDNLDGFVDLRGSGIKPYVDEVELKKMIYYANAAR